MAQTHLCESVSAFDCDVIRKAFKAWVIEDHIPEHRWGDSAALMVRSMTGQDEVDPGMLERIVRNCTHQDAALMTQGKRISGT